MMADSQHHQLWLAQPAGTLRGENWNLSDSDIEEAGTRNRFGSWPCYKLYIPPGVIKHGDSWEIP